MDKKGYTLVEVMVAITIFAMIAASVALLYGRGYISYSQESQRIEVQENLRTALNRMSREIRQALPLDQIPSQTKSNLASILGQTPTEPVSLKNNNEKIVFVINDNGSEKIISYYYDSVGKEIQRSVNGSGNNPVASNITGLKFNYDSSNYTVGIEVKGKKMNSGEVVLRTKVRLMSL